MPVSTKFEMRDDDNVIRNYGRMLIELSAAIPDGVVCFFVSYSYMDRIVSKWHDMGVLTVGCLLDTNTVMAACANGNASSAQEKVRPCYGAMQNCAAEVESQTPAFPYHRHVVSHAGLGTTG